MITSRQKYLASRHSNVQVISLQPKIIPKLLSDNWYSGLEIYYVNVRMYAEVYASRSNRFEATSKLRHFKCLTLKIKVNDAWCLDEVRRHNSLDLQTRAKITLLCWADLKQMHNEISTVKDIDNFDISRRISRLVQAWPKMTYQRTTVL